MKDASPLVRTDFSDDKAWRHAVDMATAKTADGFRAQLDVVEDRSLNGASIKDLINREGWDGAPVLFVVDSHTLEDCECGIACVDLKEHPGRTFRAIPSALWGVENNIRLAKMDFGEFAGAVSDNDVFRGFES